MKIIMIILVLLIPLIGTACNMVNIPFNSEDNPTIENDPVETIGQNPTLMTQPEKVLIDYFSALNQGDYSKAVDHYGGSYEILQGYNPNLEPEDHTALLKAGCEFNGLMCLPVQEILSVQTSDPHEFIFEVEYANPDGSVFFLGPCCGETEETMPPISTFMVEVRCQGDGSCQVLDLPPYVP